MESFSEATMKNMNDEAKYILLILNLKREEKAEEFVQKYKKVLKWFIQSFYFGSFYLFYFKVKMLEDYSSDVWVIQSS